MEPCDDLILVIPTRPIHGDSTSPLRPNLYHKIMSLFLQNHLFPFQLIQNSTLVITAVTRQQILKILFVNNTLEKQSQGIWWMNTFNQLYQRMVWQMLSTDGGLAPITTLLNIKCWQGANSKHLLLLWAGFTHWLILKDAYSVTQHILGRFRK